MWNYVLRRVLQAVVLLLVLSFVSYALMSLMPGDPVELMAYSNPSLRPEDVARLRELYGLDVPLLERYWNWLSGVLLNFDLGYSRTYKIGVAELVGERLVNTLVLSLASIVLAVLISVPLGVFAAVRAGSFTDHLLSLLAFAGVSLPIFWMGIMSILVFSVWLGWLPAGGTFTIGASFTGVDFLWDRLKHLVLPLLGFTLVEVAVYFRFVREAMLDVLRQEYMRTARAKGLSRGRVVFVHGLRNALIPITTMVCLNLAFVFSGAIITEQVFGYLGVGKMLYDAIMGNDFNVAMVAFTVDIGMVLLFNLVADVAYGFLDPRITYS